MTSEPETPSPVGGRPGPSERFFQGHKLPMSPAEALEAFGNRMTKYEQEEIKGYNDIWFLGLAAMKIHGSSHTENNNHGFDDEQYFYQPVTRDHIAYRYEVLGVVGRGSFGQVLKCFDHQHNELVALKLLRNQPRYHRLGQEEVRILQHLRDKDPEDDHHVVRMKDCLVFRKHMCISFELLGSDLHAMATNKGESVSYVRKCAYPILKCLQLLKRENIMHGDLKLANMVMSDKDPNTLKVIDFGLSLVQDQPRYYGRIGTQPYRAPEVTLGLLCTTAIDMWSFGCCLIELLIGRQAFPGNEEFEQLRHTIEILGMPPAEIVASSLQRDEFFDEDGMLKHIRLNMWGEKILAGPKSLERLLGTGDPDLLDFIQRCLHWDPSKRMTPGQALEHAWMKKSHQPRGKRSTATTDGGAAKSVAVTSRPAGQARYTLLPPFGAAAPAPPPRAKMATATTDGGAAKSVAVTCRPARQAKYSALPIGAAAPASPPSCKRATVNPDDVAANRDAGTTRPAGQAGCSLLPPVGATAPAPPPRGKRATVTTDADVEGMLKYVKLIMSGEKILPDSKRLESILGTSDPDLLDFVQCRLHLDSSKRMTPGPALEHAWQKKTSLGCMSPSPGNTPKTVILKTLAAKTTQHLKPDEATGSQPQTMNQGEMAKLGKHGRTQRPLTSELDSLVTPIGATGPAPPPRGKRATSAADGGAAESKAVTSRPARQPRFSLFPPVGAAAAGPPPRGKRATVTPDGVAAKRDAGTTRPAGQVGRSRVPPIGVAAPAPPPRGTVTPDAGVARCIGSQMHLNPNKNTGSQPQKMDQGGKAKLGIHGRTRRPLSVETCSKVPPVGAASPAPPSRGKRETSDRVKTMAADGQCSPFSHSLVQRHQLLLEKAREQLVPKTVVQPRATKGHPDQRAKRDAP